MQQQVDTYNPNYIDQAKASQQSQQQQMTSQGLVWWPGGLSGSGGWVTPDQLKQRQQQEDAFKSRQNFQQQVQAEQQKQTSALNEKFLADMYAGRVSPWQGQISQSGGGASAGIPNASSFSSTGTGLSTSNLSGVIGQLQGVLGGGAGGGASTPVDSQSARNAAYARAKEQIGGSTQGAIKALQNLYSEKGLTGSSAEGQAIGSAVGGGAKGLNEFSTQQALAEVARQQQEAALHYQGGITQRGQDMGFIQALLGLLGMGGTSTSTSTGSSTGNYTY